MSQVRVHNFSISLDGFGTGDVQTVDAPFGHAGERLHEWMFATRFWHAMVGEPAAAWASTTPSPSGTSPASAPRSWAGASSVRRSASDSDEEWRGAWGPNPPFHTPVFVLTHDPRPPLEMEGGTVFHFVDASPHEALDLARQAAGDLDVRIGGGPTTVRNSSPPTSSTSSTSCRSRSCSAAASACGTAWKASRSASTSRSSPHRVASRT